jgi:hypothetical protein
MEEPMIYRRNYENTLIKKTLNIPFGLNERPEAANIDFSKTLEKALKEEPRLTL